MKKTTTIKKITFRIFSIFIIGIILRYFINEYINIPSILEYLDCISIFISYIINYLFIEPYINYDIYNYDLDKCTAQPSLLRKLSNKKLNLDHYITNLASQQDSNMDWEPEAGPSATRPTNDSSKAAPHYYGEYGHLWERTPWVANHSNGFLHYYIDSNRISVRKDSKIENLTFDPETKRKLIAAINHDALNPPTYIEFPIRTDCTNGLISIGIKHYGNPSDPVAYYVKHFDLVNTEYIWDIWKKDNNNGLKFKFLWKQDRYKPKYPYIDPKLMVWKEMDKITEIKTSEEINGYMTDEQNPFEKINKGKNPFEEIYKLNRGKNPFEDSNSLNKRKNPFEDSHSSRTKKR